MPRSESAALGELRRSVARIVAAIPEGRFTTYGTIARRLGVNPRRVAYVLARLDATDADTLPWHRVVAAEGRISPAMDDALRAEQKARLESEGLLVDARGFIAEPDRHFHAAGFDARRSPGRTGDS